MRYHTNMKLTKKNKQVIGTMAVIAALIVGFYALNAHIYNEKQGIERMTLSGIVVCLPPKGPGPHTKECAIGLMTEDRKHYQLDTALMSQEAPMLSVSDRITASGIVTPPSEDVKYDIAGTFSITNSLTVE